MSNEQSTQERSARVSLRRSVPSTRLSLKLVFDAAWAVAMSDRSDIERFVVVANRRVSNLEV